MENNYIEIIRGILGEKLFVALSEELFNKINSKYPRIRIGLFSKGFIRKKCCWNGKSIF